MLVQRILGVTHFKLVYRHETVLPIEINLNLIWIQRQRNPSQDYWDMMYDKWNTLDKECLVALENIIHKKENVTKQ